MCIRDSVYTAEKKTIEFLNGDSVCKIGKGDLIIYGYDKNKRINTGNIRVVYDLSLIHIYHCAWGVIFCGGLDHSET